MCPGLLIFSLILFSDCITLSLSCHAIPLHQDSKICDTKQSITEKKIRLTKIKLTCFNFCYNLPYFNTFHCILKNRLRLTADVFQTDAKSLVDSVVELILIFFTYGVSFIRVIKGTNLQGLTSHYMYCMLILTKRILHSVSKLIPRERSYSNQTFEVQEVIQTLPMRNQNTK